MPTIKDVAKRAGVGVGTASRVIAGKGPVSEKTAAKVRQAIAELDFRPSHAARALLTGQSQTIGVYMPLIKGAFYTPILHAINTALRACGRHMVVDFGQTLENERQEALEGAEFLIDRGCDGLLMMGNSLQLKDVEALVQRQPNLVLLNRRFSRFDPLCFYPDHAAAGRLAAHTLLEAGHTELAYIEGPETSIDNAARMRGFLNVLTAHGLKAESIPTCRGDFSPDSGWSGVRTLLKGKTRFTVLFCANDEMAMGALAYLQQQSIAVPQTLSVLGYDGIDISAFTAPPLTTIRLPWPELAINALNHLLNCCYGIAMPVERAHQSTVLWRDSVARLKPVTRGATEKPRASRRRHDWPPTDRTSPVRPSSDPHPR